MDSLATSVKFSPLSPSVYKVNGYYIQSRFKDSEWIEVYRKTLQEDENLPSVEEVLVKSHLCAESRRCEYQVTLCYDYQDIGEVKSEVYVLNSEALGKTVCLTKSIHPS